MHGSISQDHEDAPKDSEPNAVPPKSEYVETEGAKNGGTRHLDVESVLVVHQAEVLDFIYNQAFEGIVEDREL